MKGTVATTIEKERVGIGIGTDIGTGKGTGTATGGTGPVIGTAIVGGPAAGNAPPTSNQATAMRKTGEIQIQSVLKSIFNLNGSSLVMAGIISTRTAHPLAARIEAAARKTRKIQRLRKPTSSVLVWD